VNVTVENLGPCKKLMRVEIAPEKVEEAFAELTREYQPRRGCPDFARGRRRRNGGQAL